MGIFRHKKKDGTYLKEKTPRSENPPKPKRKKKEKPKVEGRHPKGSEWKKGTVSRKKWLDEEGFETMDDYIDNLFENMEK